MDDACLRAWGRWDKPWKIYGERSEELDVAVYGILFRSI